MSMSRRPTALSLNTPCLCSLDAAVHADFSASVLASRRHRDRRVPKSELKQNKHPTGKTNWNHKSRKHRWLVGYCSWSPKCETARKSLNHLVGLCFYKLQSLHCVCWDDFRILMQLLHSCTYTSRSSVLPHVSSLGNMNLYRSTSSANLIGWSHLTTW